MSSSSAASWMIAPRGSSPRSTKATDRPDPRRGSVSALPVPSTYARAAGDQYPSLTAGSWRAAAIDRSSESGVRSPWIPTTRVATAALSIFIRRSPTRKPIGTAARARESTQPSAAVAAVVMASVDERTLNAKTTRATSAPRRTGQRTRRIGAVTSVRRRTTRPMMSRALATDRKPVHNSILASRPGAAATPKGLTQSQPKAVTRST